MKILPITYQNIFAKYSFTNSKDSKTPAIDSRDLDELERCMDAARKRLLEAKIARDAAVIFEDPKNGSYPPPKVDPSYSSKAFLRMAEDLYGE